MHLQFLQGIIGFDDDEEEEEELGEDDEEEGEEEEEEVSRPGPPMPPASLLLGKPAADPLNHPQAGALLPLPTPLAAAPSGAPNSDPTLTRRPARRTNEFTSGGCMRETPGGCSCRAPVRPAVEGVSRRACTGPW